VSIIHSVAGDLKERNTEMDARGDVNIETTSPSARKRTINR